MLLYHKWLIIFSIKEDWSMVWMYVVFMHQGCIWELSCPCFITHRPVKSLSDSSRLQVKVSPITIISCRPHSSMPPRNFCIKCCGRIFPPSFSLAVVISLKSPITSHGPALLLWISRKYVQERCFLSQLGSPQNPVKRQDGLLPSITIPSMKLSEE